MSISIPEMRDHVNALTRDISEAERNYKNMERVAFRTLALVRRFTGVEQIDEGISKCMRMITVMRQVQISAQLAMIASGPIGWAMLAVSATATAFAAVDFMTSLGE